MEDIVTHKPTNWAIAQQLAATLVALIFIGAAAAQDSHSKDLELLSDLMTRPLAQRSLHWMCIPSLQYVCTSEGCERIAALLHVNLDLEKKTYARCEGKGCDTYPMSFEASGIFTTVNLLGSGGTFLKVVNDGSEYVEVTSLHLAVLQNFGACQPSR